MIKDSGNRTKFESGAVRDIQEGKGRCDLLPFDVLTEWTEDTIFEAISDYIKQPNRSGDILAYILDEFAKKHMEINDVHITVDEYRYNLVLEVAKHFEEGAKKYGDRNWEKGIPCDRYIDSAVRHYCKWQAGWDDEPHDRAFIWNILCCEWTRQQYGWNLERLEKPEANDIYDFSSAAGKKPLKKWENILGMKDSLLEYKWPDTPNSDFLTRCLNRYYSRSFDANDSELKEKEKDESESEKGVKIGKQLSKGIQDGLVLMSSLYDEEDAKKIRWGCSQLTETGTSLEQYDGIHFNDDTEITMTVEGDFSNLFDMLGTEEPKKDQEIDEKSNIKAVLETMKKSLNCRKLRRDNFKKCLDTSCSECEYNTEPFVDSDALQTLIDYVEKSLKVQERRNPCVKDTDTGWHFYDIDGRLIAYIFDFKEPEEGKRLQLGRMLHKVWREVTSNPYTIKRILEDWGYICGKSFFICIAPSEAAKEYDFRNRKYNEEK